ncbi:MAG: response regulator transcription factor [Pedobacter sp.]|nr:MAG: response regulator transcription factor [Pedobacter sp.]
MIRCIAIDDEPLALELLQDNISKVPFLQLVAACDNAMDAMRIIEQEKVDLIFLDIQMPGLTGLQFIQSMTVKPMIILVTAYEKYALQGFNLDVTDYLVKPVSLDRFIKACNKAREMFELRSPVKESSTPATADYFFVNVEYSLVKITRTEVLYVEGLKDYVRIHLTHNQKPVVTRMPMKSIEEQLPAPAFIRVHKSYIVAVAQITSIRKMSVFLGELELPIGESYKDGIDGITGKV